MRIAIAYNNVKGNKIEELARALAQGIESQTNAVIDIFDITKESDKRLTGYSYLVFATGKSSLFSSKLNEKFTKYVKNAGHIMGKHTFVFTKAGFGSQKFLGNLMKLVESEGVLLKSSGEFKSKEDARIYGSKLHLK